MSKMFDSRYRVNTWKMCCEKNYKIGDGLKTSPRNVK